MFWFAVFYYFYYLNLNVGVDFDSRIVFLKNFACPLNTVLTFLNLTSAQTDQTNKHYQI